jgi:glycosyltransferase involved in cell wall biosynthesis
MREQNKNQILIITQHFPPELSGNASRINDLSVNLSNSINVLIFSPFPSFPHGSFKNSFKIKKSTNINSKLKHINLGAWQPTDQNPSFLSRMAYYISFPLHANIWALFYFRKYDVIITSTPPIFTAITGLFSKLILRKKWIIDVRDMWIDASISLGFVKEESMFERISRYFESVSFKNADLVCTTTEGIANKLKTRYKIKKIALIPNGVDPDYFYPKTKSKKNQIIYSGNVGHAQDLKNCILALKKIIKSNNIKLLIVGNGDIKKELENLVKKQKLEDNVIFKGIVPRDKIPEMISESLIGIAPLKKLDCLDYAIPTKVYEYMACGIPFLSSGIGEIRRLTKESNAGVIAENDPTNIADTILELLNNPKKSEEMGKNGIKYVKKYYNRKKIALNLQNYIEEMKS